MRYLIEPKVKKNARWTATQHNKLVEMYGKATGYAEAMKNARAMSKGKWIELVVVTLVQESNMGVFRNGKKS